MRKDMAHSKKRNQDTGPAVEEPWKVQEQQVDVTPHHRAGEFLQRTVDS
jgi:hypothetical protein